MKRLIYAAVTIASWLLPHQSLAQGTDVGISAVGLLAIQPIDDAYVGSPYLSEGIGGLAPGFGAAYKLDRATIDGVEAEEYETDPASPFAFTGGIDVLHRLGERTDLLFTGRYTFNPRDTRLRYLGIGAHIIRAGVGLRIRIN